MALPAGVLEPDQFVHAAGERDQVGLAIVIEVGDHHLVAALQIARDRVLDERRRRGGQQREASRSAQTAHAPQYTETPDMKKTVLDFGGGSAWSAAAQSQHLSDYKQLTHGGQNAEAYWSPDGKRLIFQTTRPPYECDQIFIMNADGTDQHLVSTGKGRTTCGYFLADSKHIVYASTHLAGDACPTPPDRSKGYVWGVFAGYDIFLATDTGKIEKRLTDTPGYDAEATVNWKTGNIVYTSLAMRRSGSVDHEARRQRQKADHHEPRLRWRRRVLARRQEAGVARQLSQDDAET